MNRENIISTPQERSNTLLKNVYLWMTAGLVLTAVVAYLIGTNQSLMTRLVSSGAIIFLVIAQLVIVLFLSSRIRSMSSTSAIVWFALYSICTGAMLSTVFVAYTGTVIHRAFFTTALMFGGMSIFAMTTKRDLSGWGSILMMAVWGLIISSLLNLIFRSEGIYYLMSYVGAAVFCGLTAWDTQKIMRLNVEYGYGIDEETFIKLSIICALELYLDFINIFLYLLRIFGRGNRR